jgi:hypothetical protein
VLVRQNTVNYRQIRLFKTELRYTDEQCVALCIKVTFKITVVVWKQKHIRYLMKHGKWKIQMKTIIFLPTDKPTINMRVCYQPYTILTEHAETNKGNLTQ